MPKNEKVTSDHLMDLYSVVITLKGNLKKAEQRLTETPKERVSDYYDALDRRDSAKKKLERAEQDFQTNANRFGREHQYNPFYKQSKNYLAIIEGTTYEIYFTKLGQPVIVSEKNNSRNNAKK